ncbi:MAG: cation:proton antiporter [Clostridiales bacterium]|nr:cation:proton antiporter [Clostridiales bacterium]
MNDLQSYLPLLIIMAVAVVIPFLLKRIKFVAIPIIVGEIIGGIIIGQTGFDLINESASIEFLSNLGFGILMFLSGMEVDIDSVIGKNNKGSFNPLSLAVLSFIGTIIVNCGLCSILLLIGLESDFIMLILLLSTTSLGIVVPILKEKGILDTDYGQNVLLCGLVADITTMLLITIYFSWCATGEMYKTLVVGLIFIAAIILYFVGKIFMLHKNITGLLNGTSQIMIRLSFFVLLGFIILTEILGAEMILGAFIAGLLVSLLTKNGAYKIREKMDAIGYGFFIPVFFVNAGSQFDLSTVFNDSRSLYAIPIVLIMAFLSKVIPALLLKKVTSFKNAIAGGFLLSARMSLIIAASTIALKMNLITPLMSSTILIVAILTCTISPIIFDKLYKQY